MKRLFIYGLVIVALSSCDETKKEKTGSENEVTGLYSKLNINARQTFGALDSVAKNPKNQITREKAELGKALYFDKRLSKDNTQSCNTCHDLNTYGVDNKSFSEGNDGGLGSRNSPTTLNAAFHIAQFWDGREPDVEAQAGGPILNPVEMAMPSEKAVVEKLSKIDGYQKLFSLAFPNQEKPITYDNLKKAIGAFERKLITPSRFDDYMNGNDDALTNKEKKGLQTYMNSGCVVCHSGKLLGGNMYQKFGLFGNYWEYTKSKTIDNGRFDVTQNEADKYFFKVPSLRNVEKTAPYFHDGSVTELSDAIKIMAKTQANKDLTTTEINEINDFLKALTGDIPSELKE